MTSAITLEQCIFCGDEEVSEDQLSPAIIAAWALRAFGRNRKPDRGFAGTFTAADTLKVEAAKPVQTAGVTCRPCNNGWLSLIDNDAARVLKPLIRGESEVELDREGSGQQHHRRGRRRAARVLPAGVAQQAPRGCL